MMPNPTTYLQSMHQRTRMIYLVTGTHHILSLLYSNCDSCLMGYITPPHVYLYTCQIPAFLMKYFPDGIRIISLLPNHQALWRNLSHTTCTLQGTNDSVMATAHQDSFLYETSGAFLSLLLCPPCRVQPEPQPHYYLRFLFNCTATLENGLQFSYRAIYFLHRTTQ